jgi:hypothetical protein
VLYSRDLIYFRHISAQFAQSPPFLDKDLISSLSQPRQKVFRTKGQPRQVSLFFLIRTLLHCNRNGVHLIAPAVVTTSPSSYTQARIHSNTHAHVGRFDCNLRMLRFEHKSLAKTSSRRHAACRLFGGGGVAATTRVQPMAFGSLAGGLPPLPTLSKHPCLLK